MGDRYGSSASPSVSTSDRFRPTHVHGGRVALQPGRVWALQLDRRDVQGAAHCFCDAVRRVISADQGREAPPAPIRVEVMGVVAGKGIGGRSKGTTGRDGGPSIMGLLQLRDGAVAHDAALLVELFGGKRWRSNGMDRLTWPKKGLHRPVQHLLPAQVTHPMEAADVALCVALEVRPRQHHVREGLQWRPGDRFLAAALLHAGIPLCRWLLRRCSPPVGAAPFLLLGLVRAAAEQPLHASIHRWSNVSVVCSKGSADQSDGPHNGSRHRPTMLTHTEPAASRSR